MSYEPLHHKYRPQTFANLVGQEAIATTLTNAIRTERIAPAYLFTGPRGTGKTSSARILAKSLNCKKQDKPTELPCGVCEVCKSIASGSALDVIEIDAASNTGVDNIREIIERAQFAPVQCRYKVYVIDECLTGDSLVQTSEGLIRIDDPSIQGKKVLSYNDSSELWEFKQVVRWLDQGVRQTLVIKTTDREIRCTPNHLIRTEEGWTPAKNITRGMAILSPVCADAVTLQQGKNLTDKSGGLTIWTTNLEWVESVKVSETERVYDLEVEDNHNFVANGLLMHNCHMLSVAAFNSLLKTLEEPPDRVVFVLATTDPQRVLPTIISRCQRFDFKRIQLEAMVKHLQHIASQENINIAADALTLVGQVAQGGLRDAESLLDQLSLLPGQVTVEAVWDLVGAVPERDLMALTEAIASNNPETVLEQCRRLMDRGREPLVVLQNLAGFYRDLLIANTAPDRSDLVALTPPTWNQLREFAKPLDAASILLSSQHLKNSEAQIKNTTQPRLWLEVTLLGLLPSANRPQPVETGFRTQQAPSVKRSETIQRTAPENRETPPPPLPRNQPHNSTPMTLQTNSEELASRQGSEQSRHQPSTSNIDTSTAGGSPTPSPAPVHREQLSTPSAVSQSPESVAPQEAELPGQQSAIDALPPSLEKAWQNVLAHVQPFTQGLLQTKGRLLSLDGEVARVSISSQPLLKIAQSKLAEIEAAFEAVYNSKVKVILQAGGTESFNTTPTNTSPSASPAGSDHVKGSPERLPTSNDVVIDPTPNIQREQSTTDHPTTFTNRQIPSEINERGRGSEGEREKLPPSSRQIDNPTTSSSVSVSNTAPETRAVATVGAVSSAPLGFAGYAESAAKRDTSVFQEQGSDVSPISLTQSSIPLPAQDLDWNTEEVEKALGNLTKFFEGEILDLTDDFQPSEPVITPQPQDAPYVAITALSEEDIDTVTEQLESELEEDEQERELIQPAATHQQQSIDLTAFHNVQTHPRLKEIEYDEDGDIAF